MASFVRKKANKQEIWIAMDLANYLVPVNADVADLDAICVEEDDLHVNALGVKESANSLCSVSHQRS